MIWRRTRLGVKKFLPEKEFCCGSVEKFVAWLLEKRK